MVAICSFVRRLALSALRKRIQDNMIVGLLKFDGGEPLLMRGASGQLLHALLDKAPIEPKVEGKLIEVELDAYDTWCCCPELLSDFLFL